MILPREYLDNVPGREGDVEEESQLAAEPLLVGHSADRVGGQHQVVVVDPDQGDLYVQNKVMPTACGN